MTVWHEALSCSKKMRLCVALCMIVCVSLSSCVPTRQIQTASPRPANTALSNRNEVGLSAISVALTTGNSPLPGEVQALRFKVDEVQLRNTSGVWEAFPVNLSNVEVLPDRNTTKRILSTRVAPVAYDSIALRISEVFVLFGENAGGPLSWPRNRLIKNELSVQPAVDQGTFVQIVFEPGASLARDADCRWYFIPFWSVVAGEAIGN